MSTSTSSVGKLSCAILLRYPHMICLAVSVGLAPEVYTVRILHGNFGHEGSALQSGFRALRVLIMPALVPHSSQVGREPDHMRYWVMLIKANASQNKHNLLSTIFIQSGLNCGPSDGLALLGR